MGPIANYMFYPCSVTVVRLCVPFISRVNSSFTKDYGREPKKLDLERDCPP